MEESSMSNKSRQVWEGKTCATPMLAVHDAAGAISFYKNVFGASESTRMTGDDGKIQHAEIKIGETLIMLADEFPEHNSSPKTLGGSTVIILIYVDNVEKTMKKAIAAGSEILQSLADQFYGALSYKMRDPYGHMWFVASRLKDPTPTMTHIVRIVTPLFAQKGFAATSMEDICNATGLSKGSIYHHFKNKEALFLYLYETKQQEIVSRWEHILPSKAGSKEKLYLLAEYYGSDSVNPLHKAAEELIGSGSADTITLTRLAEIRRSLLPVIENIMSEGMDNGELIKIDPQGLARIIFGMLEGLSSPIHAGDTNQNGELYRKAVSVVLQGIGK
jgi:PhnB protein